jgi:hypothetical protein
LLYALIDFIAFESARRQQSVGDAKGAPRLPGQFLVALQNFCAPLRR